MKKTMLIIGLIFNLLSLSLSPAWAEVSSQTKLMNINTASAQELAELPGIGDKKALAIVAYRDQRPFQNVDQLQDVKGIGPAILKKIAPLITAGGAAVGN